MRSLDEQFAEAMTEPLSSARARVTGPLSITVGTAVFDTFGPEVIDAWARNNHVVWSVDRPPRGLIERLMCWLGLGY